MKWDVFLDRLAGWFESRGLAAPGARWVIGASGGRDSTLLLHAMKAVSERSGLNWTLHAAHFHHGLRGPEADADQAFVADLADRLAIAFHSERADIGARSRAEGGSTEEVARRHRYGFLERVALKTGSECIAVGHHAGDNAETVLHRICRGTGLRGLAGISDVRPIRPGGRVRLVRPLLQCQRATIEAMCTARGFETRTDSTNMWEEFTRNRIRRTVLPLLRETLNPNVSDALLRLAEQARWVGSYLEDAAARTFDSLLASEDPSHLVLSTPALLGKHQAIQAEIVRRAVSMVLGGEPDLSFSHVEAVLRVAQDPASGKEVHLPGPVVVSKRYDRLEFRPLEEVEPPPEFPPVLVTCPGRTPLPILGAELLAEPRDVDASKIEELRRSPPDDEEWLDHDRLRLPLFVRGRRPGDRFHPLGAPGLKSVSDFLIDEKIEPSQRDRTGVLCDQNGPIWVMPLRIDERVKLREASRQALRLVLCPSKPRRGGIP